MSFASNLGRGLELPKTLQYVRGLTPPQTPPHELITSWRNTSSLWRTALVPGFAETVQHVSGNFSFFTPDPPPTPGPPPQEISPSRDCATHAPSGGGRSYLDSLRLSNTLTVTAFPVLRPPPHHQPSPIKANHILAQHMPSSGRRWYLDSLRLSNMSAATLRFHSSLMTGVDVHGIEWISCG